MLKDEYLIFRNTFSWDLLNISRDIYAPMEWPTFRFKLNVNPFERLWCYEYNQWSVKMTINLGKLLDKSMNWMVVALFYLKQNKKQLIFAKDEKCYFTIHPTKKNQVREPFMPLHVLWCYIAFGVGKSKKSPRWFAVNGNMVWRYPTQCAFHTFSIYYSFLS